MEKAFYGFNVEFFTEEIRNRPTIWDMRCETYNDRTKRTEAWKEVARQLYSNYDEMELTKQTTIRRPLDDHGCRKVGRKTSHIQNNSIYSQTRTTMPIQLTKFRDAPKTKYEEQLTRYTKKMKPPTTSRWIDSVKRDLLAIYHSEQSQVEEAHGDSFGL
ncbi:6-phosphogluconate dehydrogenase, decarboxylating [Trichonephila clavipes]|nr:6-phosphogluconate dehydrogenase, decarboxylating [Trichonephila clavipes]